MLPILGLSTLAGTTRVTQATASLGVASMVPRRHYTSCTGTGHVGAVRLVFSCKGERRLSDRLDTVESDVEAPHDEHHRGPDEGWKMTEQVPTPIAHRTRSRRHTNVALVAVFSLAAAVLATGLAAGAENGPAPISVEPLTERSAFTDEVAVQIRNRFDGHGTDVRNLRDASNIEVAEITIQPGAVFPWHTHPGPVLITIAEGDFFYVLADDCVDRLYSAGQALIDAGGDNVHTAYNPSDEEETVVIATFLDAPDDGPLTIPADGPDPEDCPLPTP